MNDSRKIIVALDYNNARDALEMAEKLDPKLCRVKVGKELFTAVGPQMVKDLHKLNHEVFLDLKFHDIPNTVAGAVKAAADLGVWMVNVHAQGGSRMMVAAKEALLSYGADAPLLIAVTVLTSMSDEDLKELGHEHGTQQRVKELVTLVSEASLDGVVCSAFEAAMIRELSKDLITVTPGIRLEGDAAGDQRRVMTPQAAVDAGVDYMVIGRSITQAGNPTEVCHSIVSSLS